MPPISVMIKPVSGQCNMNCSYCFYRDEMESRKTAPFGRMSEETQDAVLRHVFEAAEGSVSLLYQGGEPTLAGLEFYRRAARLEARYNTKRIKIYHSIQTNGLLLDEAWCSFLAEQHFLVGLSLDGIRETHDANRKDSQGSGTFDRVMEAAALLQRLQTPFNILTVVNADTAARVKEIYAFYREQGFRFQQYVACLEPLLEDQGDKPYSLTPEAYGRFLCELFDLWFEDLKTGKQPYIRQFENYLALLLGKNAESCEQRGVCGVQNVIEADGGVYPCDFYMLDAYRLGSAVTDTFAQLHEKRRQIRFLEESVNHSEKCKKCPVFAVCRGGCRRNRVFSMQEDGFTNRYCKAYQMFFGHCLRRLQAVAKGCRDTEEGK